VPFAARIRQEAGIAAAAVGMITEPNQANGIIENGEADIVLLAREMLRDPYWAVHAAAALSEGASWPQQYLRAAPAHSAGRVAVERP
jgi:2,4-dienoyl-CoA reductase-like NADH-dependent reductase (Old Yellow Enzyme family)